VQRIVAMVAVVALVLASAGIGAAVALRFRDRETTFPSLSRETVPFEQSPSDGSGSRLDLDIDSIVDEVSPAVVNITTSIANGATGGAGTGMVISEDGYVLTNNHVITNAAQIEVQLGGSGDTHDAEVVGYDVADDVAVIKIDDVSDLTTIKAGDVDDVETGDAIVALGNALGRGGDPQVVAGRVVGLDRSVTAGDGFGDAETLRGMIQVEAQIVPGDSGGPLVNADGEVIGMNTAASVDRMGLGSENTGFAIPIERVMKIADQIRDGDESNGVHIGPRGLLGVQVSGAPTSDVSGAAVAGVLDGGPADDAGIETGDVIVTVDGERVHSGEELTDALADSHPGDHVKVEWVDGNGNDHSETVQLTSGSPD
jgi:S1-C subfamily serine protease